MFGEICQRVKALLRRRCFARWECFFLGFLFGSMGSQIFRLPAGPSFSSLKKKQNAFATGPLGDLTASWFGTEKNAPGTFGENGDTRWAQTAFRFCLTFVALSAPMRGLTSR